MAFLKLRQFSSNLSYAETATDSGGLFTPFKIIDLKLRYIVPLHTPYTLRYRASGRLR